MSRTARRADPLELDEATLLKTYNLSTAAPQRWESGDGLDEFGATATGGGRADEPDPLGLHRVGILATNADLAPEDRARILLHSKAFDPKTFLATVHPTATFKNLSDGHDRLEVALKQRSEALKVLVEEEFDRFASVKGTTMGVFDEMKLGPLADGGDYGVKGLKESLAVASSKAEQVYHPILDARLKADRLRSTLGVFERNKFFFNLPGTLMESVEAGRYDVALAAYKKGRYVSEYGAAQLLGRSAASAITPLQEEQARRIIDKVWSEVERIVGDMRITLGRRLKDPRTSLEDVEKTIDILSQLKPTEDPLWLFFIQCHQHILQTMRATYQSALKRFRATMEKHGGSLTETQAALDLRPAVASLTSPEPDSVVAAAAGAMVWRAAFEVVHAVTESVMTTLPGFWKISRAYIDGKYQKSAAMRSDRTPQQCRALTAEIVSCFASLLTDFFALVPHDAPAAAPADGEDQLPLPPFAPAASNAITSAHYLLKLLVELSECANDLGGIGLLKADVSILKDLLTSARNKFVETLCSTWVRDAKIFYRLESWQPDAEEPLATVYIRQAAAFQRSIARSCMRLSGASEERALAAFPIYAAPAGTVPARRSEEPLPSLLVRRAQAAFLDALYAFLDGLVHVAFSSPDSLDPSLGHSLTPGLVAPSSRSRTIDVQDKDTRILLTVSNLACLRATSLASMVQQFEKAYGVSMSSDISTLMDVVGQLDKILFDDLIQRKSDQIAHVVQTGIIGPEVDWANAPKPTEVHAYVFESLLMLVLVHAHVSAVAPSLIGRTLGALVDELATEALSCFAKIERFGMGGMLQATLEIEFLHQTLSMHVSPQADVKLQDIYKTISQAYYRRPSSDGAAELQHELQELKRTLVSSRKATTLDFLCFRKPSGATPAAGAPAPRSTSMPAGSAR